MTKEYAIRMLADIFIPVGDRQSLIDSIYELIDDAKASKEMLNQARKDLQAVKETTASLLTLLQAYNPSLAGEENEPQEESEPYEEIEYVGYDRENQVVGI
jgi:cytolysin (calcineurin-like family phosphatase)